MKKLMVICSVFLFSLNSMAQKDARVAEIGVFAGTTSYFGDINRNKLFYSPGSAFGGLFRYTVNDRYAFRISAMTATVSGNDADFNNAFQHDRGYSFNTRFADISLQAEFSFFPYSPGNSKDNISPFIRSGLSAVIAPSPKNAMSNVGIPMGAGLKFNITQTMSAGIEASITKTFTNLDELNGKTNFTSVLHPEKQKFNVNGDDWYTFVGAFILIQIGNEDGACRAYNFHFKKKK